MLNSYRGGRALGALRHPSWLGSIISISKAFCARLTVLDNDMASMKSSTLSLPKCSSCLGGARLALLEEKVAIET